MYFSSVMSPPEVMKVFTCDKCREELIGEDHVYYWQGVYLCPDCFAKAVLKPECKDLVFDEIHADSLADALMADIYTADEAWEEEMSPDY